jgi:hypothetical protein
MGRMPKCFTTWTVLPHDPLEKHSENLWSVSGKMPNGFQRRMTVARRADGALVLHNPVALNDEAMKALEAFGKPRFLIVPNAFHRMDSLIYKQRYPELAVLCPQAARKKVSELVDVAGHLGEMPEDANVELFHLRGMKEREGALRVRAQSGTALVFNDTLLNLPKAGGLLGIAMAPTGSLGVPRFARWMMIKSGAELKAHLKELAETPSLSHVVPGHGEVIQGDAAGPLRQALERL